MAQNYKNLEEICGAVNKNSGVLTLPMRMLRDAFGAGALGRRVRNDIANELNDLGLDYFPKRDDEEFEELPPQYQDENVRLFRIGSAADDLIQAVLDPTPEGDNLILQAVVWASIIKQPGVLNEIIKNR